MGASPRISTPVAVLLQQTSDSARLLAALPVIGSARWSYGRPDQLSSPLLRALDLTRAHRPVGVIKDKPSGSLTK